MKYLKRTLVVLLLAIVVAGVVIYLQLETVARLAANSALRERGVRVEELVLDGFPVDTIRLSRLVVVIDGTRFTITGASVPVHRLLAGNLSIVISELDVLVEPDTVASSPIPPAKILLDFLQMPMTLGNAEIAVGRVTAPGFPDVHRINWRSGNVSQQLSLRVFSFDVHAAIGLDNKDVYRVTTNIDQDSATVLASSLLLQQKNDGFVIDGDWRAQPGAWLPLLREFRIVPPALESLTGELSGSLRLDLFDETLIAVSATIDNELGLRYRLSPELDLQGVMTSAQPVLFKTDYPSLDWQLNVAESFVSFNVGPLDAASAAVRNLVCDADLHCIFDASLNSGSAEFGDVKVGNVSIDSQVSLSIGKSVEAEMYETRLTVTGVRAEELLVEALGAAVATGINARGRATFEPATGNGSLDISDIALQFSQSGQTHLPFDIVTGDLAGNLSLHWQVDDGDVHVTGDVSLQADELSGFYDAIAFTDLSSDIEASIEYAGAGSEIEITHASFGIEMLDVGVPVERFHVDVRGNTHALLLSNLSMATLGGRVLADPFRVTLAEPAGEINLRLLEIQLPFMIALAEFEDSIESSGSLSGMLPVKISHDRVTIDNGRIENDPPGGIIRYLAATGDDPTAPLDIATRALGNFHFDTLTAAVEYDLAGDLKLKVRMEGINPDSDPLQPIILNLKLDNNIPQLLRSLQGTRKVEDIVKKAAQ